ncbi:MAG TPA: pyrroloquinoline quinone biosynthesis peptide chaperone PqqD [Blastocatellia bacterium]|nr:pyrroloquinoline quinone biosynthesis peptide chaperone PqqD [Blastocatellia bacterium]
MSKPALSRRARLQYDEVRQLDLLLLPERAVKLNRSAAAILALCDGQRTVGEIARELETRFEQPGLLNEILEFLHQASDQRWVV